MSSFCRLCLCVPPANLFTIDGEILEILQTCFCLQISVSETTPNQICNNCNDFVEKVNSFRKTVISNQEKIVNFILKQEEKEEQDVTSNEVQHVDISETCVEKENEGIDNLENKIITQEHEDSSNSFDDYEQNHSKDADVLIVKGELLQTEPSRANFKCLTCFQNFSSLNTLRSHYRNIHLIRKSKKPDIQYSIINNEGVNSFKCDICEKSYHEKRLIVRHLLSHDSNRPLICKVCGRTYKTVSEIIRHDRAHNDRKYVCSYKCGFSTAYTGALKVHEKGHRTEYKYKCEKCDRGFHVKTWYSQHQNLHLGIKPFACNVCGLTFYMDKHLQTHKNKVHIQLLEQQRYVCVHCMMPCSSKYAMKNHLKEHNITSSYLCDICGKTTASAVQLKAHKLTHSGIKPYSCSSCNKSFARKFNLKLHEASHSGKKQHSCIHCSKTFKQKSSLNRHVTGQHSEAVNKCLKCEQSFVNKDQYDEHKKKCF